MPTSWYKNEEVEEVYEKLEEVMGIFFLISWFRAS